MKYLKLPTIIFLSILATMCGPKRAQDEADADEDKAQVELITLDPGHFHAALVQKNMYDDVSANVHIYAPDGPDVQDHIGRIESFNTRETDPTAWNLDVYTGEDYLEKMLREKPGNVVVISGNNAKKTEYIMKSVEAGLHVLADKPMAITPEDFQLLKEAFAVAERHNVLLYDIMTERYEITTMLQKEFSQIAEVFGELQKGSPEDPAITKESVHHFFKYVSGKPIKRPGWFFDVGQQGEGVVDVATHLVDLVQWECFPGEVINYEEDIDVYDATRAMTVLTPSQFERVTALPEYPDYLQNDIQDDSLLNVYANGEINYTIKGVHAKVSVVWDYEAPEGAGDTHYSIMRGSKANLVIRQGADQNYKPTLYIEKVGNASTDEFASAVQRAVQNLQDKYPEISVEQATDQVFEVMVPESYKNGHEAHFAQVAEKFMQYLKTGGLPAWEVPNMIAKYYVTTKGYAMTR